MDDESPYDDGLALRVDYEERYYARGAILGGRFNKREGKPTTEATLTARLVDRSIRPYFDANLDKNIQVVITVLSLGEYDPDVLAINAASLALHTSDIPWEGPIAAVRISQNTDEDMVVNPQFKARKAENNYFNGICAGVDDKLGMIELDGAEVRDADFLESCAVAQREIAKLVEEFTTIAQKVGREKVSIHAASSPASLDALFEMRFAGRFQDMLESGMNQDDVQSLQAEFAQAVEDEYREHSKRAVGYFDMRAKSLVRSHVASGGARLDGRDAATVRELYAKAGGLVGRQHGTGIFYRGDTHVLSVATLGSLEDDVLYHYEMEVQGTQRWMHYYNFPDYSVGEVGPMRSPRRREIGHGELAQKAIERILPNEDDFPYAMRVVSEVMSSNGSTSMASTCAASLALMDAGVPLEKHVAGVACGMMSDGDNQVILADILGIEDHYGDMDFKIAGTRDGITAVQLDCKNRGLEVNEIEATLELSTTARMEIIESMETAIAAPRELTDQVERIATYQIPEDKIGLVIGKGGATIKRITRESEAEIDIKRDGTAHITGSSEAAAKAQDMIAEILESAKQ